MQVAFMLMSGQVVFWEPILCRVMMFFSILIIPELVGLKAIVLTWNSQAKLNSLSNLKRKLKMKMKLKLNLQQAKPENLSAKKNTKTQNFVAPVIVEALLSL